VSKRFKNSRRIEIIMAKKSIWAVCSVALLAVAFALPASAQDAQQRGPIVLGATSMHVVPSVQRPSPFVTVYDNFGTYVAANCPNGSGYYTGCSWEPYGYLICGVTAGGACVSGTTDIQENIAEPFTPKVNTTMHHVEIPVQTYAGTATFTASLQADAAGVPSGAYLAHNHTAATAAYWTCCGTGASGGLVVPLVHALTAGTQYWIVVDTNNAADTATQDVWAFSGFEPYYGFCNSTTACSGLTPEYMAFFSNLNEAMKVY
jgi:hypothetical protein